MVLKRTIHKTKNFFQKTIQTLKSHVFGGYQKLSRAPSMSLFSTCSHNPKMQQLDDFYRDFCHQWESDPSDPTTPRKSKSRTIPMKEDNASDSEQRILKKKKKKDEKRSGEQKKASGNNNNNNNNGLALKMRELEMMDVHDLDHVLDVEEVLHYYSRLKSPIYQDLVDKFFMDMYSDFSVPQPSAKPSINSSMRRLGPLKI